MWGNLTHFSDPKLTHLCSCEGYMGVLFDKGTHSLTKL